MFCFLQSIILDSNALNKVVVKHGSSYDWRLYEVQFPITIDIQQRHTFARIGIG